MSRPPRKRLFFALNPDDVVRGEVAAIQGALSLDARAVPPANFHVTLAFLGMQEGKTIPRVCEVASQTAFEPCELTLDRVGRFKRAGVLWLGCSEVPGSLLAFQRDLVGSLLAAGIGYDSKPWTPHLTLYRKMRTYPKIMEPIEVRWPLNGFSLVESVSVNRGVVYHDIERWNVGR